MALGHILQLLRVELGEKLQRYDDTEPRKPCRVPECTVAFAYLVQVALLDIFETMLEIAGRRGDSIVKKRTNELLVLACFYELEAELSANKSMLDPLHS